MMPLGTVPLGSFVKNEPNGTVPNGAPSPMARFDLKK